MNWYYEEEQVEIIVYREPDPPPAPRKVPWQGPSEEAGIIALVTLAPIMLALFIAVGVWESGWANTLLCLLILVGGIALYVGMYFLFKWLDKKLDRWRNQLR